MTTEFLALHQRALTAAENAAHEANAKLGPECSRGFDCGFAWVQLTPGNHPYVRAIKAETQPHWERGRYIWGSKLHDVATQSISVHVAAAEAYAATIREAVIGGLNVSAGSRYD